MKADFIVVGQGLAGSLLTYCLQREGKNVLVIDKLQGNASRVAAGMFNPITGRRLTLSWMADVLLSDADSIYTSLEKYLDTRFYHPMPVTRLFANKDDFEINRIRKQDEETAKYIKHFFNHADMAGIKPVTDGACEIAGGGYINTSFFLDAFRSRLKEQNNLLEEDFDFNELQIRDDKVIYKSAEAGCIIFCEGYQAIYNPYFNWLPFNLSKGDVLTISAPGLQQENIINKGIYIVPLGNALFRVGATYKWHTTDASPGSEDRAELEKELDEILAVPYEVVAHEAGIRPTVKQRRPFLGFHPKHNRLAIFNGLGTRGVILAPYLAAQMANHLLYNHALPDEGDITRYDYKALVKG